MRKKVILIITILLFVGCAAVSTDKPYNTPFINADDTIQLQEGMSKAAVLESVGDPLYIKSGIDNTIIWIYEVRSTEVLSDTDLLTKKITPNKTNANTRHSSPIHQLEIIFVNNKVQQWDMIAKKKISKPIFEVPKKEEVKTPKKKLEKTKNDKKSIETDNKLNWTVSPSLWLGATLDDMGFGYGMSAVKGKFGFEINWNSTVMDESYNYKMKFNTFNWLLLYEKNFSNFTTRFGLGQSNVRTEVGHDNEWYAINSLDCGSACKELFMRVAIGKHLNYTNINFTPMLEMNYFNEEIGFSLMARFDFGM